MSPLLNTIWGIINDFIKLINIWSCSEHVLLFTPFSNTILNFKIIAVDLKISSEFIQYNLSEQFCIVQTLCKLQLQNIIWKKMYFTTASREKTLGQLAAKLVASNSISISEKFYSKENLCSI